MSEGIFSPVLTDIFVLLSLIVSVMAFIFAAYAWSMLQSNKQHFTKMYDFFGEFGTLKDRMKTTEKKLHESEIKLEATVAANRLSRAGLVLDPASGEADMEAVKKAAEEAAEKEAAKGNTHSDAAGAEDSAAAGGGEESGAASEPKKGAADAPPWQQFIDDYNNLAASMDVPRAAQACENFVNTHKLALLIFDDRDKLTEQLKFAMVKEVPHSVYWAKMIPGEVGKYVVVPNPMAQYNNDLHENGGMKETFASNFEKGGHYHLYHVKLPALFKAKLGNWRIDKPGLLKLS